VVGGKNTGVLNYVESSGDWQVLSGTPVESAAFSVALILSEPGKSAKWDSDSTTYQIDHVGVE